MKDPKIKKYTLLIGLLLLSFCFVDLKFSPPKESYEFIKERNSFLQKTRFGGYYQYEAKTNIDTYKVPWQIYYNIDIGDSVLLFKSKISNSPLIFFYNSGEKYLGYKIGYYDDLFASILLYLVATALIVTLIFFGKDWNLIMRRNWVILLIITSIVLLCLHLQLI